MFKKDEAQNIVDAEEKVETIKKAEKIVKTKERKEKMEEGRKKAKKAIPLSQMKPNSDMLDAGIDTSREYMTKAEKKAEKEAKK